jgi:hypothetical protein
MRTKYCASGLEGIGKAGRGGKPDRKQIITKPAIASVPLRRGVQTASHTRRESVSISSPPVVKIIDMNAESWRIFLVVSKSSFAMPA